jgi:hypothetical protein
MEQSFKIRSERIKTMEFSRLAQEGIVTEPFEIRSKGIMSIERSKSGR